MSGTNARKYLTGDFLKHNDVSLTYLTGYTSGTMPKLKRVAAVLRHHILTSTTAAGSGHLTSSLSATDVMAVLFFGGFFRFDVKDPANSGNDRLIFSKGHASPLFYALWAVAGGLPAAELATFRKFDSRLEGHPSMDFPFTEVPTGSLGQGLSVGVGMALTAKYVDKIPHKTYVLLGDSEMAEGSVWEAMASASFYKLDNIVGIIDVNRLGQSRETMLGHGVKEYEKRVKAFGWDAIVIDGHSFSAISGAFKKAARAKKPAMIIAKTFKGRGISIVENKEGWHGKVFKKEEHDLALPELGKVDTVYIEKLAKPTAARKKAVAAAAVKPVSYEKGKLIATRKAYGNALVRLFPGNPDMVVLDAEVSNSTYTDEFKKTYPEHFFEMFIAEQNMASVALGMWRRGKIPFASTFAAFLARAFDQIRMAQYAKAHLIFAGSHAGVSIGEDGASQMGLEDIATFRTLLGSTVLYPSDAVSCEKLVENALGEKGIVYIRTTRKETPILYGNDEKFPVGGSKTLRQSKDDVATIVGAGITLHEALAAHDLLKKENISVRVVDLYSVKPLDTKTLETCAKETGAILTVEDHHIEGGLGEAVAGALAPLGLKVYSLAVEKMPRSGKPEELLQFEGISAEGIAKKVREIAAKAKS